MTTTSTPRRAGRALAALLLAGGLALGLPLAARALPPDGPGPESPGTSSRVWPKKVKAGDRLNFEVSGFPANETVYIKIDDGTACTDTSHGACVYHTQKLNGKGRAKGSLVVPNLAPGKHWLRMLATGDVYDAKTGEKLGYQGYPRRGGNDFTVVATGSSSKDAGGSGATVKGGGSAKADGSIAGGTVELEVAGQEASPSAAPSPTATATVAPVAEQASAAPATPVSNSSPISSAPAPAPATAAEVTTGTAPVAGIAALAGSVVVGGGAVGWALARRNRQSTRPAAGLGGE
ncbi:MAG: hypothetical protein VB093_05585 [Propionicimonas sp.]|nr:hypothetical protein [Propionicimonas sp.]